MVKINGSSLVSSLFPSNPQSFGLWCFESSGGSLVNLRDFSFGDAYTAARVLGVTTLVMGSIIVLLYLVAGCFRFSPTAFKGVGTLCILTCLFQGLVFLVYSSRICTFGCTLDTGGKCAIAATVLWFVTGITTCAAGNKAEEAAAVARHVDEPKTDEPKADEPKTDEP